VTFGPLNQVATRLFIGVAPPVLLEDLTGDGLRIEWEVQKQRGPTPDTATITVYNLSAITRLALATYRGTGLKLIIKLFAGWGRLPEQLFSGGAWNVTADRRSGTDILTVLECGDGLNELRDTPPAGGGTIGLAMAELVALYVLSLGLKMSPFALSLIAQTAAAFPITQRFNMTFDSEPRAALNVLMASIGLSWGVDDETFVVYKGGLRNDLLPSILAPQSGLLSWTPLDGGGLEFEAVAQPRVVPGIQLQCFNTRGAMLGGGPLRCETISFSGCSQGPHVMRGIARPVQVLA
jgi:hypothetical protein